MFKIPQSILVVIHTPGLQVLLVRRADAPHGVEHWQSVTGGKDRIEETFEAAAVREVWEETGIDARAPECLLCDWHLENTYEIWPAWRHRYAPDVSRNTEHLFGLCVPDGTLITLSPREHTASRWLPWQAAADLCFSPSNAEACLQLPRMAGAR